MNAATIALVGRPNVGKSTLFNRLTRTRNALVADEAGLTRDRQYGAFSIAEQSYQIIDCGGLTEHNTTTDKNIAQQIKQAIKEANMIYFIVSVKDGLMHQDHHIAQTLRTSNRAFIT